MCEKHEGITMEIDNLAQPRDRLGRDKSQRVVF